MKTRLFCSSLTSLALLLTAVPAQQTQSLLPTAPGIVQAPPAVLKAFDLRAGTVQDLALPRRGGPGFTVRLMLQSRPYTLRLQSYDVRAVGFKLFVDDGKTIRPVPVPAPTTYRGTVIGHPASEIAASLENGQLAAMIRLDGKVFGVQALRNMLPNMPLQSHIVYRAKDGAALRVQCGVKSLSGMPKVPPAGSNHPNGALKLAEIAIDADNDFYRRNGSNVTSTQNAVTRVMNSVDVIYKRDTLITYKITTIIVRTSSVYSGTSMSSLLNQFRSRWNSFHGGVKRDVAHMFTGKGSFSGIIGIAFLSVVCNLNVAYGVSKAFHSRLDVNAGLVAHELGHNWSARHCNNSNPCNIMCSGLGGCSRNFSQFAPVSIGAIVAFKNSRSCLSNPSPPILTKISPTSVKAFNGGTVTLTGSRFTGATSILLGTTNVGIFKVLSDTTIQFGSPPAPKLGPVNLTVLNGAGPSNGLPLTFVETKPPVLVAPTFGIGGFPISYTFASGKSNLWFLLLNVNQKTTIKFMGFDVLAPHVLLSRGTLNAVGIGTLSLTVPPLVLKGATLQAQIATFAGSLSNFTGTTNIGSTRFLGIR